MQKALLLMAAALMIFFISTPQAIMAYRGPGGINIHGFVSQGYLYSHEYNYLAHNSKDKNGGSFEYSEMGINFASQLTDRLRVGLQLFARDLGDVANNKITLDWAYGDYRLTNWLGVRVGKIKLPIGLYNEIRDVDMLRTSIVLPQGLYNDFLRDNLIATNGVGLYGNVGLGPLGNVDYQLLNGSIHTDNDSGVGKYTASGFTMLGDAEPTGDFENKTAYCGALRWETPLQGFKLAFSRFDGEVKMPFALTILDTFTVDLIIEGRRTMDIYSAEYTWNDLVVAAEYVITDDTYEAFGIKDRITTENYYLSISYRFTDLFTLGAYYAEIYPDKNDKQGESESLIADHSAWEKDLALTLRFDLNTYCVFKLEGHAVNGTANVLIIDNIDNDYDEADWYYGAAKVTISF